MIPKLGLTKGGGADPGPGVVEGVGGCPDDAPLNDDAPDSSLSLMINWKTSLSVKYLCQEFS